MALDSRVKTHIIPSAKTTSLQSIQLETTQFVPLRAEAGRRHLVMIDCDDSGIESTTRYKKIHLAPCLHYNLTFDITANPLNIRMKKDNNMRNLDSKYVHCAIMGDEMVGKTSISESYTKNSFSPSYEATVFDNYVVPVNVAGEDFFVSMSDVSAKKNFKNLRYIAYQGSEVLLLCFSSVDRETFVNIKKNWMAQLKKLKRNSKTSRRKRPVILVGTKIDLRVGNPDSEVDSDEGVQLAKDIGADCYVECSARDQKGLEEVFLRAIMSGLKSRRKKTNIFKQIFRRKVAPLAN